MKKIVCIWLIIVLFFSCAVKKEPTFINPEIDFDTVLKRSVPIYHILPNCGFMISRR